MGACCGERGREAGGGDFEGRERSGAEPSGREPGALDPGALDPGALDPGEGSSHQRSSGPRRLATIAATGGSTMATTHIATAAGTDHRRTKAQAETKRKRHPPIIKK